MKDLVAADSIMKAFREKKIPFEIPTKMEKFSYLIKYILSIKNLNPLVKSAFVEYTTLLYSILLNKVDDVNLFSKYFLDKEYSLWFDTNGSYLFGFLGIVPLYPFKLYLEYLGFELDEIENNLDILDTTMSIEAMTVEYKRTKEKS